MTVEVEGDIVCFQINIASSSCIQISGKVIFAWYGYGDSHISDWSALSLSHSLLGLGVGGDCQARHECRQ